MPNLHDFYDLAKRMAPITEESWKEFQDSWDFFDFKKGDILMKEGSRDRVIYVVAEGVARNYCVDEKGREYTKIFRGPGGMMGPYCEILRKIPSRYFIQAVTDLKVFSFKYDLFEQMMEKYPAWQILGRKVAEENYMEKEEREFMLLSLPAIDRLEQFYKKFGDLAEQIPQYQIASYLGMTPESFNRLLKKR